MGAQIISIGLKGMEGYRVTVEVEVVEGPNRIKIVGLPDTSIKESKERITAALDSLGTPILRKKVVVNLSPAEQRKNGTLFDLPIAIGILKSINVIDVNIDQGVGFLGALSLDGHLRPDQGLLPAVLEAKKLGLSMLYLPFDRKMPKLDFPDLELIHVSSLIEVICHLAGGDTPKYEQSDQSPTANKIINHVDFKQIIGHQQAKRALEIAAAGGHHLLMSGPPGCGKSMLAESFPTILPPLNRQKWLEVLSIYQLSGLDYMEANQPPFRNPHFSASSIAMIGGGQNPRPGEISLAHHGVLFLDEIAEFPKEALEMLRQPLETGAVTISRVRASVSYPSEFILIGAMNGCPCGYYGANKQYCTCSDKQIKAYQKRLSWPIRDRFDIQLSMKSHNIYTLEKGKLEDSVHVRNRVLAARERQFSRYGSEILNGRVPYETLLQKSNFEQQVQPFIRQQSYINDWSTRRQVKIMRLAQTIADLNKQTEINIEHIHEAVALSN